MSDIKKNKLSDEGTEKVSGGNADEVLARIRAEANKIVQQQKARNKQNQ